MMPKVKRMEKKRSLQGRDKEVVEHYKGMGSQEKMTVLIHQVKKKDIPESVAQVLLRVVTQKMNDAGEMFEVVEMQELQTRNAQSLAQVKKDAKRLGKAPSQSQALKILQAIRIRGSVAGISEVSWH